MAKDGARFNRARMLFYREQKKHFKKNTPGYKAAARLEMKHAGLFWGMMKEVERLNNGN